MHETKQHKQHNRLILCNAQVSTVVCFHRINLFLIYLCALVTFRDERQLTYIQLYLTKLITML